VFAKHHYLSHSHNNAAHVFVAYINGILAGYISVLHFPHPKVKNVKRVHRLVILPDYQGLGIGIRLLEEVGLYYKQNDYRYRITTSAPSLIYALKKSNKWVCASYGRKMGTNKSKINTAKNSSKNRITASFEFIKYA